MKSDSAGASVDCSLNEDSYVLVTNSMLTSGKILGRKGCVSSVH